MKKLALLIVTIIALAGCARDARNFGSGGESYAAAELAKPICEAISADTADYLASVYPPGLTAIQIIAAKNQSENPFAQAFETALRTRGFLIGGKSDNNATVTYLIDKLAQSGWYVSIFVTEGSGQKHLITRPYTAEGHAEASFSVLGLGGGDGKS